MSDLDLNLLTALDMLLAECSVSAAARRLGLSPSAMSCTLTRLRDATGDPLLVRAGRGLVPTPRALAMRDPVHDLVRDARIVLGPQAGDIDLASIERTFVIRASEGFVEMFAAPLVAALTLAAPRARLRFAPKPDKDAGPLREGEIDLEVGVVGTSAPEVCLKLLFRDQFVGAARSDHPLLSEAITAVRYAACRHVTASRRGVFSGPVDAALAEVGLSRRTMVVVPSFSDALRIARATDLIALVPGLSFQSDNPALRDLIAFPLPVPTPEIAISAMWHPRMYVDPVHRWFRGIVIDTCRGT
ncbi:MAG: LysR family transcriptional regulator [Sphingomonas phyllosphaerae]|uniref:LysR family transcriptional regulator n=1 Tax=Sphingomonas phyllosphaerae TaxID=257003 RepID=UPI002FFBA49F